MGNGPDDQDKILYLFGFAKLFLIKMSTVTLRSKENELRLQSIAAVKEYKKVVGKFYKYIYNNNYFILFFPIKNFMHLCGVFYKDGAEAFYRDCSSTRVQISNFIFDAEHPIRTALKKTKDFNIVISLTSDDLMILKDVELNDKYGKKYTYPYVLSNLDRSLCLALENLSEFPEAVYFPKSLRVKGNVFNKPYSAIYAPDFILSGTDINSALETPEYIRTNSKIEIDRLFDTIPYFIVDDLFKKDLLGDKSKYLFLEKEANKYK